MFVRARPAAQAAARPRPVQAAGPLAPACRRKHGMHANILKCSNRMNACMLGMFVWDRPASQAAARPRPVAPAGPPASPAAGRSRKLHGRSHLHEHDFQKRIQHTCHEKLQHACLHALHASVGPACVPSGGVGTACRRVHPCIHIWMNRHVCLREICFKHYTCSESQAREPKHACRCVASAKAGIACGAVAAARRSSCRHICFPACPMHLGHEKNCRTQYL